MTPPAGAVKEQQNDAAGPDWNADTDFDVRLLDVPLTDRRPDVVVYRAAVFTGLVKAGVPFPPEIDLTTLR